MSDPSDVEEVVSGMPYVVTSVNGRPPGRLEDFFAAPVVQVTAAANHHVVSFQGPSRRLENVVVIYEKARGGLGKDVRIWRIALEDGQFEAVEQAIY